MGIDISEEAARVFFDGVFKCKSNDPPPKDKALRCFLFPQVAIRDYYADIDAEKYTDIFLCGPTWIYYFLYKYSLYRGKPYKLHIIPEGAGVYLGIPQYISPLRGYGRIITAYVIKKLDRILSARKNTIYAKVTDAYLINPQFAVNYGSLRVINVPIIDVDDKEYIDNINCVFMYTPFPLYDKVVILDGSLDRYREGFYDVQKMDDIIIRLGLEIGKERVLLKRKHDVGVDQYCKEVQNSITFYEDENLPWELICFNKILDKSVILSVNSSVIFLPYIMSNKKQNIYRIGDELIDYRYSDKDSLLQQEYYIDSVMMGCTGYKPIQSEEDLGKVISRINNIGSVC